MKNEVHFILRHCLRHVPMLIFPLKTLHLGTDVMILKIFFKNRLEKTLAFFSQTTGIKKIIITLVFEKNAIFFVENSR
jgi:hypothetical protein